MKTKAELSPPGRRQAEPVVKPSAPARHGLIDTCWLWAQHGAAICRSVDSNLSRDDSTGRRGPPNPLRVLERSTAPLTLQPGPFPCPRQIWSESTMRLGMIVTRSAGRSRRVPPDLPGARLRLTSRERRAGRCGRERLLRRPERQRRRRRNAGRPLGVDRPRPERRPGGRHGGVPGRQVRLRAPCCRTRRVSTTRTTPGPWA